VFLAFETGQGAALVFSIESVSINNKTVEDNDES
jgi:hypothetical protein